MICKSISILYARFICKRLTFKILYFIHFWQQCRHLTIASNYKSFVSSTTNIFSLYLMPIGGCHFPNLKKGDLDCIKNKSNKVRVKYFYKKYLCAMKWQTWLFKHKFCIILFQKVPFFVIHNYKHLKPARSIWNN